MVRSDSMSNTLSTPIPFTPCQSTHPVLKYGNFKISPLKSEAHEVKVQGHTAGPTSYWFPFFLFHLNHPCGCHFWDTVIQIWPWKSKIKIMGEVKVQGHMVGPTSHRPMPLSFHVNLPVFALSAGPRPSATKNWAGPASFPFGPASFSSFSCLKIFKVEFRAGKFWNLNGKTDLPFLRYS